MSLLYSGAYRDCQFIRASLKYFFIFPPRSILQFLKINILSHAQGEDPPWPLTKPCSNITFPRVWGLSPLIHSYIHTSRTFGILPGITVNLGQILSTTKFLLREHRFLLIYLVFPNEPCWNFSYIQALSYSNSPCHLFFHLIMCYFDIS